ncbi:DNA internalization-related competence protein ComEC/Rec2 [Catenovulum sp. SM1970]|nr:DNA internalization-related competence protein ComEC/Rec2 [Marinifaba aquimaris]
MPSDIKNDWWVTGKVAALERKQHKVKFNLHVTSVSSAQTSDIKINSNLAAIKKVRLTWHQTEHLVNEGDVIRAKVKLKPAFGTYNQAGFNYHQWLVSQYIQATGYVKTLDVLTRYENSLANWRAQHHLFVTELTSKLEQQGYLLALNSGQRDKLSSTDWSLLQQTGTAHLMAVSGFHVGLVYLWAYLIVLTIIKVKRAVQYQFQPTFHFACKPQKIAAFTGLSIAWLFGFYTGLALPALRACVMLSVFISFYLSARHTSVCYRLVLSASIILLIDPFAPLSISFWLSFIAVGILIISYRIFTSHLAQTQSQDFSKSSSTDWFRSVFHRLGIKIMGLVAIQVLLFLLFIPAHWLLLGQVQTISIVANLLSLPYLSLTVIPLSILAVPLSIVSQALSFDLLVLANALMELNIKLLSRLQASDLNVQLILNPFDFVSSVVAMLLVLICLLVFTSRFKLIALCLLGLLFIPHSQQGLKIHMLDVGQGTAIVIENNAEAVLYDTGASFQSGFNFAQSTIAPFLKQRRLSLKAVIVSHTDNDHSGGVAYLNKHFADIDWLYSKAPKQLSLTGQSQGHICTEGQRFNWLNLNWQIIAPKSSWLNDNKINDNNLSCVVKVTDDTLTLLLTGDIESWAEKQLIKHHQSKLNADIALVPHHGSKTSSSSVFVQSIQAQHWLVSRGRFNRFGHPADDVVQRLQQVGGHIWDTGHSGQVTFNFSNGQPTKISVQSYLEKWPTKWWQNSLTSN